MILLSPSKCFNIAPLDLAVAVVPHAPLRATFCKVGSDAAEVTCFGYAATEAAYGDAESEAWRRRLVAYLRANRDHAAQALTRMGLDCVHPESTYLMWIDATRALPAGTDACAFFEGAGVGLTGGVPFGGGRGTVRLNFGCTRPTLDEALGRMEAALERVRSGESDEV